MVPFHEGQDVAFAHALAAEVPGATVVESDGGYGAAAGAIAGADAVLGMRLHAVVMAAAAGVPFVALSYDPKVAGFADQVGQPVVASVPGPVDRDAVVASVRKALDGPDEAYLERVALLRAEARKPAREIARLLAATS